MLWFCCVRAVWCLRPCLRRLCNSASIGRKVRQSRLKSILHPLGVGCRQLVLFTQAAVRPHCSVVTGAKIVKFGDQSIA